MSPEAPQEPESNNTPQPTSEPTSPEVVAPVITVPEVTEPLAPQAEPQTPVPQPEQPDNTKKRSLLIVGGILLVLLVAVAVWLLFFHKSVAKPVAKTSTTTNTTSKATPLKIDPLLQAFTKPTTGETWDATPQKLGNLGYYDDGDNGADTTYYQVGQRGSNVIYLRDTAQAGEDIMLYEKSPSGTVTAILHPDANETYNASFDKDTVNNLPKNIVADTTTHYDSLSPPNTFSIGKGETATVGQNGYISDYLGSLSLGATTDKSVTITTLQTYGSSKLVKVERTYADTGLTAVNYALQLPVHTQAFLQYKPISTDESSYTWSNGVSVQSYPASSVHSSTIGGIVRGCGSTGSAVSRADNVSDADFVVTGKTAGGQTVYAFKDNTNKLVQKAYSEYKDYYSGDSSTSVISFDEFLKQHALIAYKNAAGEWLIYTRNEFAAIGGCAKPVVYLYPTHAEQVNVRLGASVARSDPAYNPVSGWTVTAQPTGQLSVAGKTYGSLFWEGQGAGLYPGITAGTVVKHGQVVATLKTQLRQQGLNQTEANDFLAFWQSKIPNKPYVRLTWFNTSQMNQLAPLHVNPAPDTVIRVFLDMDGFDAPVRLPAQHLSAQPRHGFTVVEWGGLSQSTLQ